jgi:hypothetical protein
VATLADLRAEYHEALAERLWGGRLKPSTNPRIPWIVEVEHQEYPVYTNADGGNSVSVLLCDGVAARAGVSPDIRTGQGSTSGSAFEAATCDFLSRALRLFAHLGTRRLYTKPPETHFDAVAGAARQSPLPPRKIDNYAQFEHLRAIQDAIEGNPELQAAIGGDYLVAPDILVLYEPFRDDELNGAGAGLDDSIGLLSPLRLAAGRKPILHASVSCKWTMRRDRAQNTRLEALNLVRNRKGRLPHIAMVTMECDPGILGSLSLGTGDIDCVYHGALPELIATAQQASATYGGTWESSCQHLRRMTDGSRLRDIADLPIDLLA